MTAGRDMVTVVLEDKYEARKLLEEVQKILLGLNMKSTYNLMAAYPSLFDLKQTLEAELRKE